ncbi:MAG: hypothetical protein U0T33_00955 [Bacteroidales bacterium]
MRKLYILLIVILMQNSWLHGQEKVEISRKDFKTGMPGFDVAWQHIKDGDTYFDKGGLLYSKALDEYRYAWTFNRLNAELNYKMGVAALFSDRASEAADFFITALSLKQDVAGDILLLTGKALIYKRKYTEAEEKINSWLNLATKKKDSDIVYAKLLLKQCSAGRLLTRDTVNVEIRNAGGSINSSADDYSAAFSPDGTRMYFASRRSVIPGEESPYRDSKYNENIFISVLIDGKWSNAIQVSKNLTTEFCETPLMIDRTGNVMYIYAGYEGNGDILYSEFKKGEWKTPQPVPFPLNTEATESAIAICPAENELAYVSDRGKTGGKDIYFMERNGNKWMKPYNAGDSINSELDEESVSYSRGGDTIWFSSRGHNSMGGLDIFYSVRKGKGKWSKAVNAGYPINTAWDELFYTESPVKKGVFYFSSARSGGFGGLDIYEGKMLQQVKKQSPAVPDSTNAKLPFPKDSSKVKQDFFRQDTLLLKDIVYKKDTLVVSDTSSVIRN